MNQCKRGLKPHLHSYINGLYININNSVYTLIYTLRCKTFFYCAMTVYIPSILFISNRV